MPQLIVTVQGVDIKHVHLHQDRTTLGREPDNDIVLENMVVSGHHCVFDLHGLADVWVEDLRSTNGTYVNNHMARERTLLHDGDVIAIAHFRIKYLQASGPPAFGGTTAMPLQPLQQAPAQASLRVVSGTSEGLEVPVMKAVTTFGKPDECLVSVSHRPSGYFVAHLAGGSAPLLNGRPFGAQPTALSHADVLEIAGTRMLFQLKQ